MINHQSPYSYAVYNAQSDETHCHSTGFFTFPLSITHSHTKVQYEASSHSTRNHKHTHYFTTWPLKAMLLRLFVIYIQKSLTNIYTFSLC